MTEYVYEHKDIVKMDPSTITAVGAGILVGLIFPTWFLIGSFISGVVAVMLFKLYSKSEHSSPAGKAVVITGCDSGFGKALAEKLDGLGYTVVGACLFPEDGGAKELREKCSPKLHLVKLDVTKDDETNDLMKYVEENVIGPDTKLWALVNNAGIAEGGEIEWLPMEVFEIVMAVNVFGMVRVTKALLPFIRQSKGRVVNVASVAGRISSPGLSPYNMSKHSCVAFTDCLRREMKKFDVMVSSIEPYFYKTNMTVAQGEHLNRMNKRWGELSNEIKQTYTEEYFQKFLKGRQKYVQKRSSPNVYEVIDCMVDAIAAIRPKMRYTPPFKEYISTAILSALPLHIQDAAIERHAKVVIGEI